MCVVGVAPSGRHHRPSTCSSAVFSCAVLDDGRDLHVAQLAHVDVAAQRGARPAEEDIAGRLHQALAGHHALPLVGVQALACMGLQHRRARLLHLQEQRVVVRGHEQAHAADGADAADADHLECVVEEVIAVEQRARVLGQAVAVEGEHLGIVGRGPRGLIGRGVEDQRRLVLDARAGALLRHQLRIQELRRRLALRLFQALGEALAHLLQHLRVGRAVLVALQVDLVVPDVQGAHRRVVGHALAVLAHDRGRGARRVAVGEPQVLGGDHYAGRQPLDVPFEGRRQCLVQVVEVEDDVALGRGEAAEVHQVGIAACLHAQPAGRRVGQVGGHQRRRTAVEGEGRTRHAAEADRHQRGQPALVGAADDVDRIGPALGWLPSGMRGARRRIAQRLALSPAFVGRPIGRRGFQFALGRCASSRLGSGHGCSGRGDVWDVVGFCRCHGLRH